MFIVVLEKLAVALSSDSYALISSPTNERELLMSEPFAGVGPTVWHSIPDPKFFSREVTDNRFFSYHGIRLRAIIPMCRVSRKANLIPVGSRPDNALVKDITEK